jgi:hypothetical protein
VKVTYRGGTEAGRFHFIASGLAAGQLIVQARRVLAGTGLQGEPHTDVLAERVTLRFAEPQTYTVDGDLFRGGEIELAAGPRVEVIV